MTSTQGAVGVGQSVEGVKHVFFYVLEKTTVAVETVSNCRSELTPDHFYHFIIFISPYRTDRNIHGCIGGLKSLTDPK